MKALYELILKEVERIRDRVLGLVSAIKNRIRDPHYVAQAPYLRAIVQELEHYLTLADSVLDQTTRRVINGESVPNDEKVFSIFEPHTELLKRGKSWRSIEYGHMIQIEQVRSKLITGYEVFSKKPQEPDLLLAIVEKHKSLFGEYPELVTTDKGYSEKERVAELEDLGIRTSIGRKGRTKSEATHKREHSDEFRSAQAFRAGIEGTIAFLKSGLGLRRCLNKGWSHFAATIGLSVLAHNLIQLAT
jgi:IS5 family transposase